ncbi:hypothetical protein OOT46_26490, partial [Aquabacterium sp. A7-Y]|uniref:hypothetical protein n=1 Tax=Aquabacterium sp. A7-Y TaxID=1349605 RepID=UPI00223E3E8A
LERLPVHARRGAWSYRAGRFVLRHRVVVGVATVANLTMAAGLAFAAFQAYEATRERERAERHLSSVRQLANVFIFDVHAAIENLPGSVGARKLLIQTALTYLERLSAEHRNDPGLQVEIARGYLRIGDILGDPIRASLDDKEGARRTYSKVKSLLKPVLAGTAPSSPEHRSAQQEMVRVLDREAQILILDGHYREGAALLFREALPYAQVLEMYDPRAIIVVSGNLATAYSRACDEIGFNRYYSKAREALQRVLATHARAPWALRHLAYLYNKYAFHMLERDSATESATLAAKAAKQALATIGALRIDDPNDTLTVRAEIFARGYLGSALGRIGQWSRSSVELQSNIALIESEVQREPYDVLLQPELALMQAKLSQARLALGKVESSIGLARAAVTRYEALAAGVKEQTFNLTGAAIANFQLAQALQRDGTTDIARARAAHDRREACQSYYRAAQLLAAAERHQPNCAGSLSRETVRQAMQQCSR